MNSNQSELWRCLSCLRVGAEGDALSFVDRLARENHWHQAYAQKCFEEYKKFIYLMCISGSPITPSDQIDQVWHLHLTYTQSYWEDMCENVLRRKIHHIPTKGGSAEGDKFKQQYQYTLTLYERIFHQKPPKNIWPSLAHRFANADKFIRINTATTWHIKKPSRYLPDILLGSTLLAACAPKEGESEWWFYCKAAVGIYILYRVLRWIGKYIDNKKGGNGCGGGGCSGCGGCGG